MQLRPFEIVLIGIFAVCAIGGLILVSISKGGGDNGPKLYGESVEIWGTFPRSPFTDLFTEISNTDEDFIVVKYKEVDERSFESELLDAIAEGNAPDIVLLPHSLLVTYRSKLTAIPSESLDVRSLRDTYIDGAEIFTRTDGTYAVPFAVDPLVLYWNRDLFSSAGIAQPPKTWEALVDESLPDLTRLDNRREVLQSAIGMGEYQNILHAKEILSLLLFQAGNTIVEEDKEQYRITLEANIKQGIPPAQAALKFYTNFSMPNSNAYTWNRSQPLDRNAFTSGSLAMYLGLGSEIKDIGDENPNLNFDIGQVPQAAGATGLRNYGNFYGLAIPKGSKNGNGAFRAALVIASAPNAKILTSAIGLTPVDRSLYAGTSENRNTEVLEQAALIARGWLEPSPQETDALFKEMIEDLVGGRKNISQIISNAAYNLGELFK